MLLGEHLGAGGVGHLAVQRDHVAADPAEGGERLAVGGAGGDGLARFEGGHRRVRIDGGGVWADRALRLGVRYVHPDAARAAELGDGLIGVRQHLAVRSLTVLDRRDALALHGSYPACSNASHIEPSAISLSPHRIHTR